MARKGAGGKAGGAENDDAGWTTLSESAMGTILRLVGRHLPLMATRHLQKLARTSGREVAAATERSADFRIFRGGETRSADEMPPIDRSFRSCVRAYL